jgi:diaminohydroxyphosphoribosylaminopyrimidine deaminase/5-amino-6-(5-phosphoribosylamino)uracil reductase
VQHQDIITDGMRRALEIARRGPANDPNPQVGCVILDPEGRIIAEGWHQGAGTPHAEVDALARVPAGWRSRTRELTAIVTLEPCNHTGRTGPCAVALTSFGEGRQLGIGTVVYALDDPGDASAGGAATLRESGIEVRSGVLAASAHDLLANWLARQSAPALQSSHASRAAETAQTASPVETPLHVTVKWAQTLDGRAAAADGSSQWITGPEARADVHRRRAEADAILIGTGTLYSDDPSLTARTTDGELLVAPAEQPIPVVLGRREIPSEARVRKHPALAPHELDAPLQFSGADLPGMLAKLGERGIRQLFVEGGPTVASALIAAGLVDEVLVYVAPSLLGGPRLALGELGVTSMAGIKHLRVERTEALGADILVIASLDTSTTDTIVQTTEGS